MITLKNRILWNQMIGFFRYHRLRATISRFPYLHSFLNDDFIRQQCNYGLTCYILKRLDENKTKRNTRRHLPNLESRLNELHGVTGYERVRDLLRGASDWDQYQEVLAQLDITIWFKTKKLLKEMEPRLPHEAESSDILLFFKGQDIYCEVTSPQSIMKSILFRGRDDDVNSDNHNKNIRRLTRVFLQKTRNQLPTSHPGILAVETGKSAVFGLDIDDVAQQLFPIRPHVMLIMLWSWEETSGDDSDEAVQWQRGCPSFCFTNSRSEYRAIGEELLRHLGLSGTAR